ncbi:hypothetical protein, partial [Methylobacter sp.]|uniref:hypothetical protein n=1 Tax=Methylobacter sp. TaxID=2051955 RepID=UPI002489AAFF
YCTALKISGYTYLFTPSIASQLFFIPFMTPDKFAESIGLTKGVVGGWIDQGYLPTAKVGRYRMINMVVLVTNLKEGKVL